MTKAFSLFVFSAIVLFLINVFNFKSLVSQSNPRWSCNGKFTYLYLYVFNINISVVQNNQGWSCTGKSSSVKFKFMLNLIQVLRQVQPKLERNVETWLERYQTLLIELFEEIQFMAFSRQFLQKLLPYLFNVVLNTPQNHTSKKN